MLPCVPFSPIFDIPSLWMASAMNRGSYAAAEREKEEGKVSKKEEAWFHLACERDAMGLRDQLEEEGGCVSSDASQWHLGPNLAKNILLKILLWHEGGGAHIRLRPMISIVFNVHLHSWLGQMGASVSESVEQWPHKWQLFFYSHNINCGIAAPNQPNSTESWDAVLYVWLYIWVTLSLSLSTSSMDHSCDNFFFSSHLCWFKSLERSGWGHGVDNHLDGVSYCYF